MAVNARGMLKNFAAFSVVPIVTALVSLVVVPFVTGVFPEDEYGKINLFYSMGVLLMGCFMLGLDISLMRYFFEPPEGFSSGGIQCFALVASVLVDIVALAVTAGLFADEACMLLFGETNLPLLACLGVFILSLTVVRLANVDARMRGDHRSYNVQSILQTIFTKISFIVVAFAWTTDFEYSIEMMTACMAVLAACCLVRGRRSFSPAGTTFTRKSLAVLVSFGVPCMMTNLAVNLNGTIGKYVLAATGLFGEAGVFAIATTLANAFAIFTQSFSTYWSPFMYENWRTAKRTITQMHDLVMFGTLAVVVAAIAFQDVLFLVVGGSYARCQSYFMLIMLSPIQGLVCETTSYGILLRERPVYNVVASVAGLVASAVISLVLVPQMGALGAAIGVAVSSVIICLIRSVVGQALYASVASPARSLAAGAVVVALCAANVVLCSMPVVRTAVCAVVLAGALLAYRRQLAGAVRALRRRS